MDRQKIAQDAGFLKPFLVEPALLDPDLLARGYDSIASELLRRVVEIMRILKDDPRRLTVEQIEALAREEGSQIGSPGSYMNHVYGTAAMARGMTSQLHPKGWVDSLPEPDYMFGLGLAHDFSKMVALYGEGELDGRIVNFGQFDLEITQYVLSTVLGVDPLQEVSLHCGYPELVHVIAEGVVFPGSELYVHWRNAFNIRGCF